MASPLERLIERALGGDAGSVFLITGDRVLAEPAAERLAAALSEAAGCRVETHRRPPRLAPLLADLRTYSLFDPAKVVLAVDTGTVADSSAAAAFVDEAADVDPPDEGAGLDAGQRAAALRLLQAVRLFDVDPHAGEPSRVLDGLPEWVFKGGPRRRRKRSKKQAAKVRDDLVPLLAAAREEGLQGIGEDEISDLAAVARDDLPEGHALVLAETSAAPDHPVVASLEERGAVLRLATVEADRGGAWQGVGDLGRELARQTGVEMEPAALDELARRTLRKASETSADPTVAAESTARLAAEYRKLAHLARGAGRDRIDRAMVRSTVEDRGQQDVFAILDAVGEGRGDRALADLARLVGSAEDPVAARLTFFALFSGFCRHLTAVVGAARTTGARLGESHYPRFKSNLAPKLQGEIEGHKSPLAGIHPYRLHRAYLAASRLPEAYVARLPARVLETEVRIKGDSGDPDAALAELVAEVAARARRGAGRGPGRGPGPGRRGRR